MLLANLQHKRWVLVTTRDTDRNIKLAGVKTLSIIGSILNETEFGIRQDAQEDLFLSNHDIIRSQGTPTVRGNSGTLCVAGTSSVGQVRDQTSPHIS